MIVIVVQCTTITERCETIIYALLHVWSPRIADIFAELTEQGMATYQEN